MIQVQARIHVQKGQPLTLEIDILSREDSSAGELKIATAIQEMIVKMNRHVANKIGAQVVETVVSREREE